MDLKQIFLEAIPLSVYREKIFKQISQEYKERYRSWFDGKWRVFLPIEGIELSELEQKINKVLSRQNYEISNWEKGLAKSLDSNREQRIGKLLQAQVDKTDDDTFKEYFKGILKQFTERTKGRGFAERGEKIAVISRHPMDIAGQSYDRAWTSCKNLKYGINKHFIPTEIDDGCLVAYCIWKSDYLNKKQDALKNPIARYLIVSVMNEEDEDDTKLFLSPVVYGKTVQGFYDTVSDWLIEKQGEVDFDEYSIDDDRAYTGDVDGDIKIKGGLKKVTQAFENDGWYVDIDEEYDVLTATTTDNSVIDELFPVKGSWSLSYIFSYYTDYGNYENYPYQDQLQELLKEFASTDSELSHQFFEKVIGDEYNREDTDTDELIETLHQYNADVANDMAIWYHESNTDKELTALKEEIQRALAKTNYLSLDIDTFKLTFQADTDDEILRNIDDDIGNWLHESIEGMNITYESISQEALDNQESVTEQELENYIRDEILN